MLIWLFASSASTSKSSAAIPILLRPRRRPIVVRGYRMFDRVLSAFAPRSCCLSTPMPLPLSTVWSQQRVRIATMDLRIASIALSQGLTLLTRNARDFSKVPGLVVEDWTI